VAQRWFEDGLVVVRLWSSSSPMVGPMRSNGGSTVIQGWFGNGLVVPHDGPMVACRWRSGGPMEARY
jgi:hypothetical protein